MEGIYKLGDRRTVLRRMAEYAIRDQQALIHALITAFKREPDEISKVAIQDAKMHCRFSNN